MSNKVSNTQKKPFDKNAQRAFEKKRFELGLKYAKTTFIRYMTAVLSVMSLYWIYPSYLANKFFVILPLSYFIGFVICTVDQYITINQDKAKKFALTDIIMKITAIIDLLLIISALINYKLLFPYFKAYHIPVIIFSISVIIKLIIILKIKKQNKIN